MQEKRRLFVGGHMHGQVMAVPQDYPTAINTIDQSGDGLDVKFTQVTYYLKQFAAGATRIDVYVVNHNTTAGEILAALAQAAGVDTGRNTPPDTIG